VSNNGQRENPANCYLPNSLRTPFSGKEGQPRGRYVMRHAARVAHLLAGTTLENPGFGYNIRIHRRSFRITDVISGPFILISDINKLLLESLQGSMA
jgi:hypothetical protein